MHGYGRGRGVVLIFGVVAHALDLMVPEAIRKKLEPMHITFTTTMVPHILIAVYLRGRPPVWQP